MELDWFSEGPPHCNAEFSISGALYADVLSMTDSPRNIREVLAFRFNGMGVVVSGMLVTALALNVVALTLPFMVLKVYGDPEEAYSIPRTVQLMWSLEFYVIAVLIIGFSLIFPFLKLSSLLALWYIPMTGRVRGFGLRLLGSLGRWSLLDVFVALVLIVLAHDQTLFVTAIKPGLPLFLAAICLSMLTGELMTNMHVRSEPEQPIVHTDPVRPADHAGWRAYLVPLLLIGSLASISVAVGLPYIRITAWYLHEGTYSVLQTVYALWEDKNFLFMGIVGLFLVVMPVAKVIAIGQLWYVRRPPAQFRKAEEITRTIGLWAMLDVFGLALALFLSEGSNVIKVQGAEGVWAMLAAIILNLFLGLVAGQVIRGQLRRIST